MHRRRECVPRLLVSFWPVSGSKNRVIVSISSYAVKSNMFPRGGRLSAIFAPAPSLLRFLLSKNLARGTQFLQFLGLN